MKNSALQYRARGRTTSRFGQNERGMTTLGILIMVIFVGLFVFGGLRLTPVYLNYFKVVGVVNGVQEEFDGQNPTRTAIRGSISRRFSIDSVGEIKPNDVKVTAVDGGFEVSAAYPHKAPFIGNINFVVEFDKKAMIRR